MNDTPYQARRGQIEHYFDRTAVEARARLTSGWCMSQTQALRCP